MVENPINPKTEMAQKGYFWDSVFFEEVNDQNFIYIVVKSEDFSSIMLNENNLVHTPFREIYEKFQRDAWIPETYTDIEEIFCFNESMVFITWALSNARSSSAQALLMQLPRSEVIVFIWN